MKSIFFGKNLKYLRKINGLNQDAMLDTIGFKGSTWSGYEIEKSFPKFEDLIRISEYFGISEGDLINMDLSNVEVTGNLANKKNGKNVEVKVERNVEVNANTEQKQPCQACAVKDQFIAIKEESLRDKAALIEQLNTNIKLLQNQIDQMKYELHEREESQHTQRKERKSA